MVWKCDLNQRLFLRFYFFVYSLVLLSIEKICQTLETVFHHISKILEFRQKYSTARRLFDSLLSVWKYDETLSLVIDIFLLHHAPWISYMYSISITFSRLLFKFNVTVQIRQSRVSLKSQDEWSQSKLSTYNRSTKHNTKSCTDSQTVLSSVYTSNFYVTSLL